LNKEHIKQDTHSDTEQGVLFPFMKKNNGKKADPLRHCKRSCGEADILQTIDYQKSDNGKWQDISQIFNIVWCFTVLREQKKG
jgi:hypothetical protein